MQKEAESHAEDDRRKRELIDARNAADQTIYRLEKMLKENGDKLSDADKAPLQSAIAHVKEVMTGNDVQAIRRAVEDLEQAAQAMAQHLQQGRQPAGAGTGAAGPGNGRGQRDGQGRDDVIDAEYEVKK